jgi:hypothetical protein
MYYIKYLKYKKKYLQLKQLDINQIGGELPNYDVLKNISLFPKNSDIDLHLNPIYGFLWNTTGAINNYYNSQSNNNISKLIKRTFTKNLTTNIIRLTNDLLDMNTVTLDDFANFIAHLYLTKLFKINKETKTDIQKKISIVTQFIDKIIQINNSSDATKILKLNDEIDASYNRNFKGIRLDGLTLNIPTKDKLNKHKNLLCTLKTYRNDLEKIIREPNIAIKKETTSKKTIRKYYAEENTKSLDIEVFYVILAALWWKLNNKQGIINYYNCLNKYLLDNMKITIPDNYINDLFTKDDFRLSNEEITNLVDFGYVIAYIYASKRVPIQLINYEKVYYTKKNCKHTTENSKRLSKGFSDCGETTLRNFINILIYDVNTGNFDLEKLEKLGATEDLKIYYTVFNNMSKQLNPVEVYIFGEKLNPRDAWGKIVSNLNNVKYDQQCNLLKDDSFFDYEIDSGINRLGEVNMVRVIKELLTKIPELNNNEVWEKMGFNVDFDNKVNDITGIGDITIKMSNLGTYKMLFDNGHYDMIDHADTRITNIHPNLDNFTDNEKQYIIIMSDNIYETNDFKVTAQSIYLMNYDDHSYLKNAMNYDGKWIESNIYNEFFNISVGILNIDEKKTLPLNLNKIKTFDVKTLKEFDIQIKLINNLETSEQKSDIIEIINTMFVPGEEFNNLQKLTICDSFNEPLDRSLDNLTNLQTLTIGNVVLGDSLNKLTNLQTLTIGNGVLGDSLDKLTNLETLIFGDSFNQSFNKPNNPVKGFVNLWFRGIPSSSSLDKLINLKTLTIGNGFNQLFDNSLANLTNLQNLTIGDSFNEPLYSSLDNLINLQTLTIGDGFNKRFGESLAELTNLQTLTIGNNFHQPLDYSLRKLVNLQTLQIGDRFNGPLYDSLDNLTNLQTLNIGDAFTTPLYDSLDNLTNLQTLTIGKGFHKSMIVDLVAKLTNLNSIKIAGETIL